MINVNPSHSLTSGALKPQQPHFDQETQPEKRADKSELKQNLPKALDSKPTGLDWLVKSVHNAIAYVFNAKAKKATIDHELGHLLLFDLTDNPATSIKVDVGYKKGELGCVIYDVRVSKADLQKGLDSDYKTHLSKSILNRMLSLKAGTLFEAQLHPNLFAFMSALPDMHKVKEDLDELFVHLNPAYKTHENQKELFKKLDEINQAVFDAIPMKSLEGLRAELLDKGEIKGKDNCQDLLRRHLKKEEGFDWGMHRKHIDQELTKLVSVD